MESKNFVLNVNMKEAESPPEADDGNRAMESSRKMIDAILRKIEYYNQRASSIYLNHEFCRYKVVKMAVKKANKYVLYNGTNEKEWTVFWFDKSTSSQRVMNLKSYQYINHFPGMYGIARKMPLSNNLLRMQNVAALSYNFFPESFAVPEKREHYENVAMHEEGTIWIVKPNAGSLGKGIYMTDDYEKAAAEQDCVIQRYMDRPMLLDSYKFDLRVYCFIRSISPLRIYMYRKGLVRICTSPYEQPTHDNMENAYMHLTNYTLNKTNANFDTNAEKGSKRSFEWLNSYFKKAGLNSEAIWESIGAVLVKTVISILPSLRSFEKRTMVRSKKGARYNCFEILGFDILLDADQQPWLMEVNHSPSLNLGTPLDVEVKTGLIKECLNMLAIDPHEQTNGLKRDLIESRLRLLQKSKQEEDISFAKLLNDEYLQKLPLPKHERMSMEEEDALHISAEQRFGPNYALIYPNKAKEEEYEKLIQLSKSSYYST